MKKQKTTKTHWRLTGKIEVVLCLRSPVTPCVQFIHWRNILTKSLLTQKHTTCTLRRFDAIDNIWYSTVPLGVNHLSQMLSRMCKEAGTRSSYTNHSIRATAIQKLSDAGLQAREIMAVSGHRSKSSLKSYWRPSLQSRKCWSAAPASDQTETIQEKQQKASNAVSPNKYLTGCMIYSNVQINVNNGSDNHHLQ